MGQSAAGQFEGQVALITGGARGQRRSHDVAFAREGDVALIDLCRDLSTVDYPLSSAAVLFLAGRGAAHITGAVIDVSAGASAPVTA